ncbi:MAG: LPS export ABC transporter periplasmic protein LptC [Leeuwenhoekiella sp.]|nr:LPS export ABC transporter periplasmic protein LptC [Leeuwenhoekiella sp.]MBA82748.1 LPS export ABC transporter periplasmic protein LptC [Leeuwenhoekiella sp.]
MLNLVTAFAVTLFFSCGNNAESIQQFNQRSEGPSAEGEGVLLKYTDSGKVVATLKTPLIIEYGLADFPYEEFPEGVEVTFIDDDKKENYITSDYAIRYKRSGLIDLRENVVLITSDSTRLDASQLFWDQKDKWVFTDKPYTIEFPDDSYNKGDLFDSSEDFKNFISLDNQSRMYVQDSATSAPKDSIN